MQKIVIMIKKYAQVVLVFLAFTIMVVLSCFFMINMEFKHLRREAETTISHAQDNIVCHLQKAEVTLNNITEIVRIMTGSGENAETVEKYIKDAFDGEFYANAKPNEKIIANEPRFERKLGMPIITYTRNIYDSSGKYLGIVYLDSKLDDIQKHIINMQITEDGYGMLLSKDLEMIVHPFRNFLGESLHDLNVPLSRYEDELMQGQEIFERRIKNYKGAEMVMFLKQLENGWYLGAATPEGKYYKNVIKIAEILCIIAFGLSLLLGIILIRIIKMKDNAENYAKNANKAKSIFLARMSHEIRTPMNAILGITEIELQQDKAINPNTRKAFAMIYNSSNLLMGIINNILDLSKIEAGKMEIIISKYELASLINDVVQLNIMRNSKHLEFEIYVDENLPALLMGDEIRIKQILNNLLSNAFKYTKEGRIKLAISFEKGRDALEAIIIFAVSDTGDGMTKEQANNLFTEYTRFNLKNNRYVQGTGLGMNITQQLLQMMNGHISVESELGKGSTFTVRLPQKRVNSVIIGWEQAQKQMQLSFQDTTKVKESSFIRKHMPHGKVLIVDDVESNLYVAKGLMTPYGLSIDVVTSGFEAIEKIKEGNIYDIIFMDHMMPEIDGIETTNRIREMGYTRPIVALTANAIIGQTKLFFENGFDDFVSKPIDIRQLNKVLNKFVCNNESQGLISKTELLALSIADAKNILPVLESTLENIENVSNEDLHLFTIKTHAIKSIFANLNEVSLSRTAYALEVAGKAHDKQVIKQNTRKFINSVNEFIEVTAAAIKHPA
ncbi:MAG: ATP-binding protein [Fibromonadales bacterium]|nr:ATP-binding protein [Fibromonadales bacterium]